MECAEGRVYREQNWKLPVKKKDHRGFDRLLESVRLCNHFSKNSPDFFKEFSQFLVGYDWETVRFKATRL